MKNFIITAIISLFVMTASQASTLEDLIVSGNTFWSQGKLTEAEAEFNKALEIDPQSHQVHARLANLYLTQNKTLKAVEEFQEAIIGDHENAHYFIGLSIAYLHQKRYAMAEAVAKQAIELNPDLANAKKLMQYIDAKNEKLSMAPQDTTHGQGSPHGQASPHGQTGSTLPATIQKNIKDSH